jgi:hypothetical protein
MTREIKGKVATSQPRPNATGGVKMSKSSKKVNANK